jgi:biotin carboxylase
MPAVLTPSELGDVSRYAADVLHALGLDLGIFHLEVMLTDRGPILIEANPRLIGGTGPWLLRHAFDVDIFDPLIRVFTGGHLDASPLHPSRYAVSRLIGSTRDATCPAKLQLEWLTEYRDNMAHWQLFVTPGTHIPRVRSNHDYIGSCVVTGPTATATEALADEIIGRLSETLDVPIAQ